MIRAVGLVSVFLRSVFDMTKADEIDPLNAESRRLEQWYLLLGELSQCLWFSSDLTGMLRGFCKILTERAGYLSAEIELDGGDTSDVYRARSDQIETTACPAKLGNAGGTLRRFVGKIACQCCF
jgi:hypothetical protein